VSTLKAGRLVYRVIEEDPPPPSRDRYTWKVTASVVASASTKQIKLKTPLPEHNGTVFKPDALGRLFYETPAQVFGGGLDRRLRRAAGRSGGAPLRTTSRSDPRARPQDPRGADRVILGCLLPGSRAPRDRATQILSSFLPRLSQHELTKVRSRHATSSRGSS